jgi:hypothetical protein
MGKPLALALSALLLALPLACGDDDDDTGGTGGKAGSAGKGGSGGNAPTGGTAGKGSGGTAGAKSTGGTVSTGGAGGADAGEGQGGAVPPGGAGGDGGTGAVSGEAGSGTGGALGGQGGEAGSMAGSGGEGGSADLGAQFATAAALLCAKADTLDCPNEATCEIYWTNGYEKPECVETFRAYIDCAAGEATSGLQCDAAGNAGPKRDALSPCLATGTLHDTCSD